MHYARRYKAVTLGRSGRYRGDNQQMMPSRARLASATAAGVVGLAVAGLILFGTDPLGMGSTVIAVPASPNAAAGAAARDRVPGGGRGRPTDRPWRPQHDRRHAGHDLPARAADHRGLPAADHLRSAAHLVAEPPADDPATADAIARPPRRRRPAPTTTRPGGAPTHRPAQPTSTPHRLPVHDIADADCRPRVPDHRLTHPDQRVADARADDSYASRSDWAAAVLDRLNAQRASHGLPALTQQRQAGRRRAHAQREDGRRRPAQPPAAR